MELGSEFAKGAADKVTGVKFPVLMRVVLPGLAATAVIYRPTLWFLGLLAYDPDHWWERVVAYIGLLALLGASISILNSEIYKIYMGRGIFWSKFFFEGGRQRQQARVDRLFKEAKQLGSGMRYDELWYQLRDYPENEQGDPEATHPTQLGNILTAYERYPAIRYGMDAVFYWSRIWLQLDKEKKEEIDSAWSVADGLLTLSAISLGGGALWLGQAAAALFGVGEGILPLESPGYAGLGGLGWLFLGFVFYRLSLPFHRQNGETFKAIFDVYRKKVWKITALKPQEKAAWKAAWAYLQYARLHCPNCKTGYNGIQSKTCSKCGFGLDEFNRAIQESGNFPTPPEGE